jgi:hypothetical protein
VDGIGNRPHTRVMHRPILLVSAVLFLLLAPSASAVVRHASPMGDASSSGCTAAEPPCSLKRAVETVANPGDEVILAAGTYTVTSPVAVNKAIDVHGAAGVPRPRVTNASAGVFSLSVAGARLAHVQLEAPGSAVTTTALPSGTSLLEGLTVLAGPAGSGSAVRLAYGWLLRDSVVHTSATNGVAVHGVFSGEDGVRSRVVNVTAVASAASGVGILADSTVGGICVPDFSVEVYVTNTVARGGLYDLSVPGLCSGTQILVIGHSNYRQTKVNQNLPQGRVESQGGNQELEPIFAAPASLAFHQLASSATIDAGVGISLLGTSDIDREPRIAGTAPDIGADEYIPPPPPAPQPPPTGAPDVRAPVVSILSTSPSVLRSASRRGTRIAYALDEAATVKFTVKRAVRRRNRTRYVALRGSFADSGEVGGNTLRFRGRLRGRRLKPGRYRLLATPTDSAGNVGRAARTAFRIIL